MTSCEDLQFSDDELGNNYRLMYGKYVMLTIDSIISMVEHVYQPQWSK
jgi:hypothetical protein